MLEKNRCVDAALTKGVNLGKYKLKNLDDQGFPRDWPSWEQLGKAPLWSDEDVQ